MQKAKKSGDETEIAVLRREVVELTTKLGHAEAEAKQARRSVARADTEITRLRNRQEGLLMALSLARHQAMELERQIERLYNGDPQAFTMTFNSPWNEWALAAPANTAPANTIKAQTVQR